MTTKWKIVTGFVVMVMIVGVVLFLGYSGIQKSSDNFVEYRRLARLNVAASDLGTALNSATTNIRTYIDVQDTTFITAAHKDADAFLKILVSNEEFARNPATKEMFASLKTGIVAFKTIIDNVQKSMTTTANLYSEVVPDILKMIDQLDMMTGVAERTGNTPALATFSKTLSEFSKFTSAISRFANTHTVEDSTTVKGYITRLNALLEDMRKAMPSEAGQRDFGTLKTQYDSLTTAFAAMDKSCADLRAELDGITSFLQKTSAATASLNDDLNTQMITFGAATLGNNADTQNRMLAAGSGGFVLGIIIALVILIGIVRTLKDLSGFSHAVSEGNFAYAIKVREKGEIGGMVAAMQAIPAVLGRIITTVETLAAEIRQGHLRNRFDVKTLPGSFANLGTAVNTLSEAYTMLVDVMPVPVIACDPNFKVIYASEKASQVLGDKALSLTCRDQLNSAQCGTENCLGKRAMATKKSVTDEATIHPQGVKMNVSVTAIPLFDNHNDATGFIEIITDLTEIKAKQDTILRVAAEASSISDRVAAASEELAAQVEQISRGADVQRSRVESTASAMNEMNATVLEVARNASEASEQSERTRGRAEGGAGLVNQVVNAINKVQEVGAKLDSNMQELGQQAESIGGVMNVISDIADQTNLLALNAAIEAARAGEAGRGFAVVADEVRKLAEKTMAATHEVGANISAIQNSAKVNIEEVGLAVRSVGEATELARSSGEALHEIVTLAAANSSVVASIATAAEEQSATSEEINGAIEEINRITQETTNGMTQSSEAVQDLSSMAQELRRVMEGLR